MYFSLLTLSPQWAVCERQTSGRPRGQEMVQILALMHLFDLMLQSVAPLDLSPGTLEKTFLLVSGTGLFLSRMAISAMHLHSGKEPEYRNKGEAEGQPVTFQTAWDRPCLSRLSCVRSFSRQGLLMPFSTGICNSSKK